MGLIWDFKLQSQRTEHDRHLSESIIYPNFIPSQSCSCYSNFYCLHIYIYIYIYIYTYIYIYIIYIGCSLYVLSTHYKYNLDIEVSATQMIFSCILMYFGHPLSAKTFSFACILLPLPGGFQAYIFL